MPLKSGFKWHLTEVELVQLAVSSKVIIWTYTHTRIPDRQLTWTTEVVSSNRKIFLMLRFDILLCYYLVLSFIVFSCYDFFFYLTDKCNGILVDLTVLSCICRLKVASCIVSVVLWYCTCLQTGKTH